MDITKVTLQTNQNESFDSSKTPTQVSNNQDASNPKPPNSNSLITGAMVQSFVSAIKQMTANVKAENQKEKEQLSQVTS